MKAIQPCAAAMEEDQRGAGTLMDIMQPEILDMEKPGLKWETRRYYRLGTGIRPRALLRVWNLKLLSPEYLFHLFVLTFRPVHQKRRQG